MLILIRPFCHNSISALFCQSFYNSSTRPVWTLWAKPITLFFSLSLSRFPSHPHPPVHLRTQTQDLWSNSLINHRWRSGYCNSHCNRQLLPFSAPFLSPLQLRDHHLSLRDKKQISFFKQAPHLCPQTQGVFLKEWWKKKGFGTCEVMFKKNFIA